MFAAWERGDCHRPCASNRRDAVPDPWRQGDPDHQLRRQGPRPHRPRPRGV